MSEKPTKIDDPKIRYDICKTCEFFFFPTRQCKLCGCQMNTKVHLADADCPAGKW